MGKVYVLTRTGQTESPANAVGSIIGSLVYPSMGDAIVAALEQAGGMTGAWSCPLVGTYGGGIVVGGAVEIVPLDVAVDGEGPF